MTVVAPNRKPTLDVIADQSVIAGNLLTLTAHGTDPDTGQNAHVFARGTLADRRGDRRQDGRPDVHAGRERDRDVHGDGHRCGQRVAVLSDAKSST